MGRCLARLCAQPGEGCTERARDVTQQIAGRHPGGVRAVARQHGGHFRPRAHRQHREPPPLPGPAVPVEPRRQRRERGAGEHRHLPLEPRPRGGTEPFLAFGVEREAGDVEAGIEPGLGECQEAAGGVGPADPYRIEQPFADQQGGGGGEEAALLAGIERQRVEREHGGDREGGQPVRLERVGPGRAAFPVLVCGGRRQRHGA